MDASFQDRVRERAYQLWLEAGRVDGCADRHWLEAERDVLADKVSQLPRKPNSKATAAPRQRSRPRAA
jgi:hypothetical protein